MSEETVVGAFRLLEQVGRGGMGVVWRAEHLHQGAQAAVKLITGDRSQDPQYREQFRNEAEAMAMLHHPGIVRIFDYGIARTGGADSSPYLAMAWAPNGTLMDIVPIRSWIELRERIVEVLDALSHAHARGVVHRDLKPRNILVGADGGLLLADFGIARRRAHTKESAQTGTSGTPRWMAPEQIRGHLRDQGPWTDLYSLGCIVFWLLTYRAPYHAAEVNDILRGHLYDPIPRLRSRIAVPHDIESWLRRLLAKDPNDRYRHAADALYDLLQYPDEISVAYDASEIEDPHDTDTLPEGELETELFGEEPVGLEEPSSYATFETSAIPARLERRPPPPRSWVRQEAPVWPMTLIGAGLGLWGLRPIPMVDREEERDALWGLLREVCADGSRVVVLRGPSGTGKSRLASWLSERAHEVGAAHVFSATHSQGVSPADGLPGGVTQWFRAHGLAPTQILGRIRAEFEVLQHRDEHFDALALGELVERGSFGSAGSNPDAQVRAWDAWLRYLRRATTDRPALLWFDDVQWGAESLGFIEHALEQGPPSRLLFVLTVREEALSERPVERARLTSLMAHDLVAAITIESLAETHRVELVERMLRLDADLAREVADRTAGNPLFAVQLTDDWVQRGLLEVGENGFVLAPGATPELPRDLQVVWSNHLQRFLATRVDPEASRDVIELAATLGQTVTRDELDTVVQAAGLEIEEDLFAGLTRAGLLRREPSGWSFCHAMLREAIASSAREAERGAHWHSVCADFIRNVYGSEREHAERLAHHLISATRLAEALPALLTAAEFHARRGDYDRVGATFRRYDEVLLALGLETGAERTRGKLHRARNMMFGNDLAEVDALLSEAEAEVDLIDNDELRGDALFARSRYHRHQGESAAALPFAEQAFDVFSKLGNEAKLAATHRALGELYRRTGRMQESVENYRVARRLFGKLGDDFQAGWSEFGLAATAKQMGDAAGHAKHLESSIAAFEQARSYSALSSAYNERGEMFRMQGRCEEALEAYMESLQTYPAAHADIGVTELNIGLTHVMLEDWRPARQWLRRSMVTFKKSGRTGAMVYIELAMVVCAAGERRWTEYESLVEGVAAKLAGRGVSDTDTAMLLEHAGDLCHESGEFRRAIELWEASIIHWGHLGREAEVEALRLRLAAPPT